MADLTSETEHTSLNQGSQSHSRDEDAQKRNEAQSSLEGQNAKGSPRISTVYQQTRSMRRKPRFVRHILKHGNLTLTAISAIASVTSACFFYSSLKMSNDSLKVSLNAYQRGYVDHLSGRYAFAGDEEYLVLQNAGAVPAYHIVARRVPYFVLNDRAVTVKGLAYELKQSKALLKTLVSKGVVTKSSDYADLMGPDREISIKSLDPGQDSEVEVSESANLNGVRIASALGGIFVVQWRVGFTSGPDQTETTQVLEFWLSNNQTRENLSGLSWGDAVVTEIEKASKTSRDYLLESSTAQISTSNPSNPYIASMANQSTKRLDENSQSRPRQLTK